MTVDTSTLKSGLYSIRDFVRKGQEKEYANALYDLMAELAPEGILEQCFATEIMKATWRLRRCRNIEFDLAETAVLDPMIDEQTSDTQKTVDRARNQSHYLLRRSISELTKLQTNRTIRMQLEAGKPAAAAVPNKQAGISGALETFSALADKQLCQQYREQGIGSFTQWPGLIPTEIASQPQDLRSGSFCNPAATDSLIAANPDLPPSVSPASFCKTESEALAKATAKTENSGQSRNHEQVTGSKTPRNAPCPCGSGAKHKKCCGNPTAPEVKPTLNRAA